MASGASRIGFWRYERERGNASQAGDIREHPIHRWRGPPSPMGKAYRWRLHHLFLLGDARRWYLSQQSPVTSHSYDTREGIISHAWYEILRLSPHLFWRGFFTHTTFLSAQDDDTRGRKGSHLGDTLRVLELAVLYYDTSSPLEKGRAKGAGWIHVAV